MDRSSILRASTTRDHALVRLRGRARSCEVTILLSDDLLERLETEARGLGIPRSEFVRESLTMHLGKPAGQR